MKTILIDAACGGIDYGYFNKNRKEKDDNLRIAHELYKTLLLNNIKVFMLRTEDVYLDIKFKIDMISKISPDLIISIHRGNKDGIGFSNTNKDITAGYKLLLEDSFKQLYDNCYNEEKLPSIVDAGFPIISIYFGNINNDKENEILDKNLFNICEIISTNLNDVFKNSYETIKNIIVGKNNGDIVLGDNDGYYAVGRYPACEYELVGKSKSYFTAKEICMNNPGTGVFLDNDPNAEFLYYCPVRKSTLSSGKYKEKLCQGTVKNSGGAQLFSNKDTNSTVLRVFTLGEKVDISAANSDKNWLNVIDRKNNLNGYIQSSKIKTF